MSKGGDHEQALALSAHYLSLVKKNGRRIANLKRYDFPKPEKFSKARPGQGTEDSAFGKATDTQVCDMAIRLRDGAWDQSGTFRPWVDEARNRGLKPKDCLKLLEAS